MPEIWSQVLTLPLNYSTVLGEGGKDAVKDAAADWVNGFKTGANFILLIDEWYLVSKSDHRKTPCLVS